MEMQVFGEEEGGQEVASGMKPSVFANWCFIKIRLLSSCRDRKTGPPTFPEDYISLGGFSGP